MESYYRILNLSENCSRNEVVDAYRKLAVIHHPDKGGDSETFKKISRAYEILTDKDKRSKYDNSFLEDMYINYTDPDKIFEMVMKKIQLKMHIVTYICWMLNSLKRIDEK